MRPPAHITRDLPYAIADLGVTAPDGASRKPDSERVSAMLTAAEPQVLEKLTALYGDSDPTLAAGLGMEPMVFMSVGQIMQIWREYVWRAAEQLLRVTQPTRRRIRFADLLGYPDRLARTTRNRHLLALESSASQRIRAAGQCVGRGMSGRHVISTSVKPGASPLELMGQIPIPQARQPTPLVQTLNRGLTWHCQPARPHLRWSPMKRDR